MMKYLQKLGKALMLPVAVLPICGILMGLGYALAPGVMGVPGAATSGAAYTVGFLLVKAGGALIDNMAWLFAIGAAVGLADNDGTAGLAGLVSYLMMQQLLSPGVVGMVRTLEEGTATYIAFQKVAGNSFIGILAAVVGAACYNKFKNTQLPDWLAFFSGKRFVAIATGLISILVSVVLLFVWPVIFDALVAIGNGIAGMDGIGAGIYAGGQLIHGMLHPEAGHITLPRVPGDQEFECVCPTHSSCFEGLAAGPAVVKRYGVERASDMADDEDFLELEGTYIAQGILNYLYVASPQRIILGGGVPDHAPKLMARVRAKVLEFNNGYIATPELDDIDSYIVQPACDGNQGVLGAIALGAQALQQA